VMSQKINAIVFSRDRAAQLKIFLDSAIKNAPEFKLNVIYGHTNEAFEQGYDTIIKDEDYEGVNFIKEESLRDQALKTLKSDFDHSCFFLDDDIIYKKVSAEDVIKSIKDDEDVVCFSLRLGKNTTYCYTIGEDNVMHDIDEDGDIMKWDWKLHYLDFGYPFSLNGHIFRTRDIYKLVRKAKFATIEEMEMQLFDFSEHFPRNLMASYTESRLVNVPTGRVQLSVENEMTMALKDVQARKGRQRMNEQLLRGESPDFLKLELPEIEGCHQDIDLGFLLDSSKGALDAVAAKKYGKLYEDLDEDQQEEINKAMDAVADIAEKLGDNE